MAPPPAGQDLTCHLQLTRETGLDTQNGQSGGMGQFGLIPFKSVKIVGGECQGRSHVGV